MTKTRYNELLNDKRVYQVGNSLDFQCISCCKRYSIGVYYNPPDLVSSDSKSTCNKPFLGVFPSSKFNDITKPIIKSEQIFLMFSDSFENAFSYILTMNCDGGEAFLKVLDMPNVQNQFITEREITGISKKIHPDLKKFLAPKIAGSFD